MPEKKKKKASIRPRTPLAVSVSVIADRNATAACASIIGAHYTEDMLQAAGTSKRMSGDPYHPEIGTDLAVGRALLELALQLIQRGESLVLLEAETRYAEQLLAAMKRTEKRLRRSGPHPGLRTPEEILADPEHGGQEAANLAARRRGLPESAPQPPQEGRDNGLPTVDGKDSP